VTVSLDICRVDDVGKVVWRIGPYVSGYCKKRILMDSVTASKGWVWVGGWSVWKRLALQSSDVQQVEERRRTEQRRKRISRCTYSA
jgi:hypothetical protein